MISPDVGIEIHLEVITDIIFVLVPFTSFLGVLIEVFPHNKILILSTSQTIRKHSEATQVGNIVWIMSWGFSFCILTAQMAFLFLFYSYFLASSSLTLFFFLFFFLLFLKLEFFSVAIRIDFELMEILVLKAGGCYFEFLTCEINFPPQELEHQIPNNSQIYFFGVVIEKPPFCQFLTSGIKNGIEIKNILLLIFQRGLLDRGDFDPSRRENVEISKKCYLITSKGTSQKAQDVSCWLVTVQVCTSLFLSPGSPGLSVLFCISQVGPLLHLVGIFTGLYYVWWFVVQIIMALLWLKVIFLVTCFQVAGKPFCHIYPRLSAVSRHFFLFSNNFVVDIWA
ncbi:hypothetical protein VP01_1248g1 [Puccinia sorghi]|uniref:Uncharacterized protein n=1 Tax=Puccinia sorghi TaxID=27349 RepID=A0A0L6VPR8_9BASI|nr:hypothetical protein VP01_1248g1 [Puccinia sorghi]